MIGEPPVCRGARQVTVADPLPAVALRRVGAFGAAPGVAAFDGADAAPVPRPFTAATVTVYGVPLVKAATVALVAFPPTRTVRTGPVLAPA